MRSTSTRLMLIGGCVAAATLAFTATAGARAPVGSVKQLPGKAGCYTQDGDSEDGPGTCRNIRGGPDDTTSVAGRRRSPSGR